MSEVAVGKMLAESKHPAGEELPESVRDVLRWGLARTPYLGGGPREALTPQTVGDLARMFDYLLPQLHAASREARIEHEELDRLQGDVAAFRRVLGVTR